MTPELVKKSLSDKGMTISQWARMAGFSEVLVYSVLSRKNKASRGQSHQIAVALGLKPSLDEKNVPEFIKKVLEKEQILKNYKDEGAAMK
jgi:gp16 family phage-associated protein